MLLLFFTIGMWFVFKKCDLKSNKYSKLWVCQYLGHMRKGSYASTLSIFYDSINQCDTIIYTGIVTFIFLKIVYI